MQAGSENAVIEQQQQAQAQAQQQAPGQQGGAGVGPTPSNANLTPMDTDSKAQETAQQWLSMDEGQRKKAMAQLEASNPTLHAVAMRKMEAMRRQGASQGRAQVYQQAQQGGQQ